MLLEYASPEDEVLSRQQPIHEYSPQIQAVFKRFAINVSVLEYVISSGAHVDNILGNKEYTEDIDTGYVYIFTWERGTDVEHTRHQIDTARRLIPIPSYKNRVNVYYAYSRIVLSRDRLENIKFNIRCNPPPSPLPYRLVRIDSRYILEPRNDTPVRHVRSADGKQTTIEIYLYDWFGYLEECATFYKKTLEKQDTGKKSNYENYKNYLEEDVDFTGAINNAGVKRRDLYAFADMIDDLVQKSERPSLSKSIGGSFRNELEYGDVSNEPTMYSFYNEARESIDALRSGGDTRFNRTIRLIPSLLANQKASATYIDYLYEADSGRNVPNIVEVISNCLYKWKEVLHRQEREKLMKVWGFPTLHIDEITIVLLNRHLEKYKEDHHTPMAQLFKSAEPLLRRYMEEVSFFIHFASGFGVPRGGELPENAKEIIGVWSSAELQNNQRLMIHLLLEVGLYKGRPDKRMVEGVVLSDRRGNKTSWEIFGRVINLETVNKLEVIKIPTFIINAVDGVDALMEFHHFLVEMEMAAQMAHAHRGVQAIPYFLSGMGSGATAVFGVKALVTASKAVVTQGIAVGSFFSFLKASVNTGTALSTGNRRVALMYGGSGAAYLTLTAMALAKILLGRVVAGRGNPWLTAGMIFAGLFLDQQADKEFMDKVRLVVRHSMWGKKNEDMPGENEKALIGRWWTELDESDGRSVSIEDEVLAIVFSNAPTDDKKWHEKLMHLKAKDEKKNIRIRETLLRNSYLLNLVTQLPPVTVDAGVSNAFTLFNDPVQNYPIWILGLQNFTLIKTVSVKLKAVSTGRYIKLSTGLNSAGTEELIYEGDNLLPLFLRGNNQNIEARIHMLWAERLLLWFVAKPQQPFAAPLPNVSSNPRFILFDGLPGRTIPKKTEIVITYEDDCLLPVRIEQEFSWLSYRT